MKFILAIMPALIICALISLDAKHWNDAARDAGHEPEDEQ
jgi:hypothetical protein